MTSFPDRASAVHLTTVHHSFDPRIFYRELPTLRDAGLEVHLVAPHPTDVVVDDIPVHALPTVHVRHGWLRRLARLRLQGYAARRVRRLAPDLIHFHDPELIPLAFLLKQATGAAVIYDMHEDYRWHGGVAGLVLRALERWCFRWVDHVLVANPGHRNIVPVQVRSTVLPNYVRLPEGQGVPRSPALPPEGRPFRLVYAGFQGRSRGLMQMIELARQIREAGLPWQIDLVGACRIEAERAAADALIRRHRLDVVIRRIGWNRLVPWPALLQYYRRAHVGLFLAEPHPAYLETQPTKFFEYLRFGLPILCTDLPAWRAFIDRHRCGAVVPADDTSGVLEHLHRWAGDATLYERLSRAAQEASLHYRWERVAPRLLQVYRDLLGL